MLAEINSLASSIDLSHFFSGLVGGAISALITHRAALGRDRRKEFNDVARPLYKALGCQLSHLEKGAWQQDTVCVSADLLLTTCPRWRRSRIRRAVAEYHKACEIPRSTEYDPKTGRVVGNPAALPAVIEATKAVRKVIHPF